MKNNNACKGRSWRGKDGIKLSCFAHGDSGSSVQPLRRSASPLIVVSLGIPKCQAANTAAIPTDSCAPYVVPLFSKNFFVENLILFYK